MKRILIILGVVVVALTIALTIRLRQMRAHLEAPSGGSATIEATEVDISPRIGARLLTLYAREGDTVQAGQLLVDMDCADTDASLQEAKARLAMAQSNVDAAKANALAAAGNTAAAQKTADASLAQAKAMGAERFNAARDVQRTNDLFSTGSVPVSQVDLMQTRIANVQYQENALHANYSAAQARVSVADKTYRAALAQSQGAVDAVSAAEAVVKRAEVMVGECHLKSSINGVVQTRNFEPGEVVLPGSRILTLIDLHEVKATFYIPNAELAAAGAGKKVSVRADAYPDQVFYGTIARVSSKAEFTPRNVQTREDRDRLVYGVEVRIPNDKAMLRPGMPVEIAIEGTGK